MRWGSIFAGAVGGLLLAMLAIEAFKEFTPPAIETVNLVKIGNVTPDRFEVRLELRNFDRCPGMTSRYLWRDVTDSDGTPIRVFADVGPNLPPFANSSQNAKFIVSLERPRGLPPGAWHYQSRTTSSCSWLSFFIGPRVRFSPDLVVNFEGAGS